MIMNNLPMIIKKLTTSPGIYQFIDKKGEVLYIGKAKNLKKRVSSYFAKKHLDVKTNELVKRIVNLKIVATKNELEAFLLEASLIKKNKPPYNIDLKEGSGRYAYLQITNEVFPRIVTARTSATAKSGKIFGPYTSSQTRREAQYLANTTFKLRVCKTLPKQACLLYHINLCSAPCIKKITPAEYDGNIKKAAEFLKGDIKNLIEKLKLEMSDYARDLKYEQAKIRRDQITAIERISDKQNIDLPKNYDQDVFNFVVVNSEILINAFNIKKGLISGIKEYVIKNNVHLSTANDRYADVLSEFIRRYYDSHFIPDEIILPIKLKEAIILEKYLSSLKNKKVILTIPKQGGKKELLNLLWKNLEMNSKAENSVLYELQQKLNLPHLPVTIEMFDISHTSGTEIVASMVQFKDGRSNTNAYRRFKIKTVKDNDDFASMREVVSRRYKYLLNEGKEMPDLIIVDGGRGQLTAALGVLRTMGVTVPLVALAKKKEDIYTVGRRFPVKLNKISPALRLMQRIRDEAHRFAITFHRQRRSKKMLNK